MLERSRPAASLQPKTSQRPLEKPCLGQRLSNAPDLSVSGTDLQGLWPCRRHAQHTLAAAVLGRTQVLAEEPEQTRSDSRKHNVKVSGIRTPQNSPATRNRHEGHQPGRTLTQEQPSGPETTHTQTLISEPTPGPCGTLLHGGTGGGGDRPRGCGQPLQSVKNALPLFLFDRETVSS